MEATRNPPDETRIMAIMEEYMAKRGKEVGNLPDRKLFECIPDSLEAVEFLIHVEEALGFQDGAIDLNLVGPKIADRTFAEIAREIQALGLS